MGKRRQTKEQFIQSRETARASETKAAEAKRMQDEALANRNINRTRLDLYRSKLRQQPEQPGLAANPIGSLKPNPRSVAEANLSNTVNQIENTQRDLQKPNFNINERAKAQPYIPQLPQLGMKMAKKGIGSAVGNQVIGGSGKSMVQPGLQDGGLLYNDNVRSLDDMASGMVPQMSSTPTTMQGVPYTEWPKKSQKPDMREDTQFLTGKGFNETFDPNKKEIPLVFSPEERKSQQAIAPVPYEDKYGGFGGLGKTADELKEPTPPAPKAKSTDAKPAEEEKEEEFDVGSFFKSIKPKEAPEATQYRAFNVNSNDDRTDSTEIKDVMSARREALMKMMGGR
jgi:hypothetical protein